ncbi:Transcription factor IIIA [Mycena sanguinolenta]|uniref:Transcription factor IIIA n=1 Tax=Mycena sanguinolenta TaxID=230812 RepID=A0A8H6ZE77_9AGAR|nr:Transcription factor IIIA [Mycena sanguinolenta]
MPIFAVTFQNPTDPSFVLSRIVKKGFGLRNISVYILIGTMVQNPLFVPTRTARRHLRNTTNYELIDSFATSQHLRTHSKVHNEKRYTCSHPSCLSADGDTITYYPTWTALQHHTRTVHPPTCSHVSCNGRIFSSQKGLRAHQKLHEQQTAEASIDAMNNVDGEPPLKKRRGGELGRDWKCDVDGCTKDFKSKKALTTHTNVTHLGRRDHICPHETCGQAFGHKHLLQRHLAKRHTTSSESSDEDATSHPAPTVPTPTAANMSIDTITGNTYAQAATKKLKAAKALRCPYPDLDGLAVAQAGLSCEYVFSRAYDFRRHLHSQHDLVLDKHTVEHWVRGRWSEQMGSSSVGTAPPVV